MDASTMPAQPLPHQSQIPTVAVTRHHEPDESLAMPEGGLPITKAGTEARVRARVQMEVEGFVIRCGVGCAISPSP